jgi:hypothetical protein
MSFQTEAISCLIFLALRSDINQNEIISQLKGNKVFVADAWIRMRLLCADVVVKALDAYNREKIFPELFSSGKQSADILSILK